jgi:hypothetical protein
MMHAKVFQAQALDNRSSDHLRLAQQGAELHSPFREQTYSGMASISAQGTLLFAQDGVKLLVKGNAAVLQVIAEERDHAGRLAPVVCWVEQDAGQGSGASGVDAVWASLEQFATAIGRSFSEPTRLAAREALELLAKKQSSQSLIALAIAFLQREWAAWLKRARATLKNFCK